MIRVLFVCLGNICRSPMAEAVCREKIRQRNLEHKIEVDSAGTGTWHIGNPPHKGTVAKLEEHGISAEGMIGRRIEKGDFDKFDYIVGLDTQNIKDIRDMLGQPDHSKIFRFLDITENKKDVPDPYFTGDFQETYELVSKGCDALIEMIVSRESLSIE